MPRYLTSAPHFTHTRKWGLRPKYTLAVRAPSLLRYFRHQEGSRTVAHPVRVQALFETAQVKLVVLRMCWARPSALFSVWVYFECCADTAVRETERNAESEEAFRLLLLIGNVLKTDSKTKPTSKLNCRVIIFIYKLGCQECKKRHLLDIILNSFELWMNMTKLHRQHFVFFTAHYQNTWMLILHHCYYKNMQLISYQSKTGLVLGHAVRSAVWLM